MAERRVRAAVARGRGRRGCHGEVERGGGGRSVNGRSAALGGGADPMRALFCALFLTMRLAACALEGTVTDGVTGKPLPGVRVYARVQGDDTGPAYLRRSDAQGRFCFERLAPGTYRVIAQHLG